nr:translocation/assembly module TamB domain-containing protein [bacterium]
MKFLKFLLKFVLIIIIIFFFISIAAYIFHKPILNYIQKKAFQYALAEFHREFKDLTLKVKDYDFDWKNRLITVDGVYLNSKTTGFDAIISKITVRFNISDKLYPISEIEISGVNIFSSADFKEIFDKLKNIRVEPDSTNKTFFVKKIKINNLTAVLEDTFTAVKYKWKDMRAEIFLNFRKVGKINIDTGRFSFLILNKGFLSLLEKRKITSGNISEMTLFDDSIFEYESNTENYGDKTKTGFVMPSLVFAAKNKKTILKIASSGDSGIIFDLINIPLKFPKKESGLSVHYDCSILNFEGTGKILADGENVDFEFLNGKFKAFGAKRVFFEYDFKTKKGLSLDIGQIDFARYFENISGKTSLKLDIIQNGGLYGSKIVLVAEKIKYEDFLIGGKFNIELGLLEKNKLQPLLIKIDCDKLLLNNYLFKIALDSVYEKMDLKLKKLRLAPYKPVSFSDYKLNSFIETDTGAITITRDMIKFAATGKLTNFLSENYFEIVLKIKEKKAGLNYEQDKFKLKLDAQLENKILKTGVSAYLENNMICSAASEYGLESNHFKIETSEKDDLKFAVDFKSLSDIKVDLNMNEKFLKKIGINRKIDSFSSYLNMNANKKGVSYNGKILYSEKDGAKFLGYINGINTDLNIEKIVYEFDKTGMNITGSVKVNIIDRQLNFNLNNYVNNLKAGILKFNGNLQIKGNADLLKNKINLRVFSNDISVNNSDLEAVCLNINFDDNKIVFTEPGTECWSVKGKALISDKMDFFSADNIVIIKNGKEISVINGGYDLKSNKINFKYSQLSSDLSTLAYYTDAVRKIEGSGSFFVDISNTIDNPVVNAELALKNVNLYLSDYIKEIKNINGSVKIKNNEVYFDNIRGENHKGYILLTSDSGSNINNLNVNLFASKIFLEVPEVELTAQADIKGKLIGTIKKPVVKGDAYASNAQFTYPPINPPKSSKYNPNGIYPSWDANVHIRENVRYKYMTVEIELDRGTQLYFKGTKFDISVKGFLSAHSGKVPYLNRKFDLVLAEMIVNSDAGIPVVTGECETVIDGLEIKMTYSGPVDKFKPSFRIPARPELSEEEAAKIIRFGTIGQLTETGRTVDSQSDYGIYKFVDSNLSAIIGKPIEERLLKDFKLYFNLNAPLVENLVKSGETSDSGSVSANLLMNTSISLGKYLFKDLYFEYRGKVVNANQDSFLSN